METIASSHHRPSSFSSSSTAASAAAADIIKKKDEEVSNSFASPPVKVPSSSSARQQEERLTVESSTRFSRERLLRGRCPGSPPEALKHLWMVSTETKGTAKKEGGGGDNTLMTVKTPPPGFDSITAEHLRKVADEAIRDAHARMDDGLSKVTPLRPAAKAFIPSSNKAEAKTSSSSKLVDSPAAPPPMRLADRLRSHLFTPSLPPPPLPSRNIMFPPLPPLDDSTPYLQSSLNSPPPTTTLTSRQYRFSFDHQRHHAPPPPPPSPLPPIPHLMSLLPSSLFTPPPTPPYRPHRHHLHEQTTPATCNPPCYRSTTSCGGGGTGGGDIGGAITAVGKVDVGVEDKNIIPDELLAGNNSAASSADNNGANGGEGGARVLLLSRDAVHRMLLRLVAVGCNKQKERWLRGEDVVELLQKEEEEKVMSQSKKDLDEEGGFSWVCRNGGNLTDKIEKKRMKKKEKRDKKKRRKAALRSYQNGSSTPDISYGGQVTDDDDNNSDDNNISSPTAEAVGTATGDSPTTTGNSPTTGNSSTTTTGSSTTTTGNSTTTGDSTTTTTTTGNSTTTGDSTTTTTGNSTTTGDEGTEEERESASVRACIGAQLYIAKEREVELRKYQNSMRLQLKEKKQELLQEVQQQELQQQRVCSDKKTAEEDIMMSPGGVGGDHRRLDEQIIDENNSASMCCNPTPDNTTTLASGSNERGDKVLLPDIVQEEEGEDIYTTMFGAPLPSATPRLGWFSSSPVVVASSPDGTARGRLQGSLSTSSSSVPATPPTPLHSGGSPSLSTLPSRLANYRRTTVGILVSAIKTDWQKMFPGRLPLDMYMQFLAAKKLKQLLLEIPNLVLTGQGGFMRVATVEHAHLFGQEETIGVRTPISSDCSPPAHSTTTSGDPMVCATGRDPIRGNSMVDGSCSSVDGPLPSTITTTTGSSNNIPVDQNCWNIDTTPSQRALTTTRGCYGGATTDEGLFDDLLDLCCESTDVPTTTSAKVADATIATTCCEATTDPTLDMGVDGDGATAVIDNAGSPTASEGEEPIRQHLKKILHTLLSGVCQHQHARQLAGGEEEVKTNKPVEAAGALTDRLSDPDYVAEGRSVAEMFEKKGVAGLRVSDIDDEWMRLLKTPLDGLLNKTGYHSVSELLSDVPTVRVVGDSAGEQRCYAYVHEPQTSKQQENEVATNALTATQAVTIIEQAAAAQSAAMSRLLTSFQH
eukprot:GHVS01037274.1.p1 GENE.GHVS01037274.1~~GHVS01037274.1.p1  ORF type:complete len:1204 (+),score=425.14 GHVS01037274.1:341-3952(+)